MAIEEQLDYLREDIENAYENIAAKGGQQPANRNTDNLAGAIDSIVTYPAPTGHIDITANGNYDVAGKAEARVNVPGSPSGTIEITENGDGIDVAAYATANVNVAGGGGVEDKAFSQEILSTQQVAQSTSTALSVATGSFVDLGISFYTGSYGSYTAAFPYGMSKPSYTPMTTSGDANVASFTNQKDFSIFDATGSATATVDLTAHNMTYPLAFKFPGPVDSYNDAQLLSAGSWKLGNSVYCYCSEPEWTNATVVKSFSLEIRYNNATYQTLTGSIYAIPIKPKDASLANVNMYQSGEVIVRFPNSYGDMVVFTGARSNGSNMNVPTGWLNQSVSFTFNSAFGDPGDFCDNLVAMQAIPNLASAEYQSFRNNYVFFWVKTGHTVSEIATRYADTTLYQYGNPAFIFTPNGMLSNYTFISNSDMQNAYRDIFTTPPTSVTVQSPAATRFRKKASATRYLHEFTDNMRLGTIELRDEETWETVSHTGVYGTDDDADLSNVDKLSNSNY